VAAKHIFGEPLIGACAPATERPLTLDFYADWCVSCKEMDRFTFTDPSVADKLAGVQLLRADVTADNAEDKALLKRFALFGPPGAIFFDSRGREVPGTRVIGFESADQFLLTLALVFGRTTRSAVCGHVRTRQIQEPPSRQVAAISGSMALRFTDGGKLLANIVPQLLREACNAGRAVSAGVDCINWPIRQSPIWQ
jgi:thiol-disulfide isomerase/thioredoxin